MGKLDTSCSVIAHRPPPPRPRFGARKARERVSPPSRPAIRQQPVPSAELRKLDALVVRYVHEIRSCERAIAEADAAFDGSFKDKVVVALRSAIDQHREALSDLHAMEQV